MLAVGYCLGALQNFSNKIPDALNRSRKLDQVLYEIQDRYVDSVSKEELANRAIAELLKGLDPHSVYIPTEHVEDAEEQLRGQFGGVGIKFLVLDDTLTVTEVIQNGPSYRAGLAQGDKILQADSVELVGSDVTTDLVLKTLKGIMGTEVNLTVKSQGELKGREVVVRRGGIAIPSVIAGFMMDTETAFIKIARFGANTVREFETVAQALRNKGMKKLILDLRENGGGYLQTAEKIVDQFLERGELMVYTEGNSQPRLDRVATSYGFLEDVELAVLINSNSASASEIVAGAVQDNDRGVVLGRRSFGKGLVQEPIELADGSVIRLTVSRYYTPSGRCIQKAYGDGINYGSEVIDRLENGGHQMPDSSHFVDSMRFETKSGRVVYGGGGITPDIFIPVDTAGYSVYYNRLFYASMYRKFCFSYYQNNSVILNQYSDPHSFAHSFKVTDDLLSDFAEYAAARGVRKDSQALKVSRQPIASLIKATLASYKWGENGYYEVRTIEDKVVQRALLELNNSEAEGRRGL